jgi:hypothetical protein
MKKQEKLKRAIEANRISCQFTSMCFHCENLFDEDACAQCEATNYEPRDEEGAE